MTSARVRPSCVALAEASGLVHASTSTSASTRSCSTRARVVAAGALGDVWTRHGGYLQDWLLLRHRLELAARARARAASCARSATSARTGSTWSQFLTGRARRGGDGRPRDRSSPCASARRRGRDVRRRRPTARRDRRRSRPRTPPRILLRFEGGARGAVTLSQVSAGRKNHAALRDRRRAGALAWDSGAARGALARPPRRGRTSCCCATRRCCARRGAASRATRPATPRASPTRSSELYRAVYRGRRARAACPPRRTTRRSPTATRRRDRRRHRGSRARGPLGDRRRGVGGDA